MSVQIHAPQSALTLGIVGYGTMGKSLALGIAEKSRLARLFPILVYETYAPNAESARNAGLALAPDMAALGAAADMIILAVKPDQMAAAVKPLLPALKPETLLISIAAGISLDTLAALSKGRCFCARVMPNTPALVGQGIFGLCFDGNTPPPLQEAVRFLLSSLGLLIEIPEKNMNGFTALSGSGPGYVFHFMESLAEAGVSVGLDRESSRAIASALFRGCVAMAEKGTHPAVLREQVSSPGGTTIAGLNHLDRSGVRGILIDAVHAAARKSAEMEKGK